MMRLLLAVTLCSLVAGCTSYKGVCPANPYYLDGRTVECTGYGFDVGWPPPKP